jgi:XapX domain-containing protein
MKPYLYSLAAGLAVGIAYSVMGVRSPAPPVIALIGLFGILLGEHIIPLARHITQSSAAHYLRDVGAEHVFGRLPGDRSRLASHPPETRTDSPP